MTQYPTPELLVNECFEDIEQFSKAVRWNLDFRQIDPGPLNAKAILLGNEAILVLRFEFNRGFHQIGRPPEGLMTFGFPDKESGVLRWNGIETPPGVLINFNYETMLDCVTPPNFGGYVLSFKKEPLSMAAERLGLGPNFIDDIENKQFWDPKGDEHHQLRQFLQALEMVALEDDNEHLGLWKNVFNYDLPTLLVRILVMNNSTQPLTGPSFRTSAMSRAISILKDYEHNPVNVEALCVLVGVSWATLQRAFTEEFGITPSKYIKSRRLAGVQSELIKIGPGAVISDVANHWGFWHMGSFASDYRKQFGELPSETLRHLKRK
jgi:AraC family ethanolamine operon transcriptional activator